MKTKQTRLDILEIDTVKDWNDRPKINTAKLALQRCTSQTLTFVAFLRYIYVYQYIISLNMYIQYMYHIIFTIIQNIPYTDHGSSTSEYKLLSTISTQK